MGRVRVRHGAVTYAVKQGDNTVQETAFRNMVIDLSDAEEQRLRAIGAVVDEEHELTLPGRLTPIPNTASDEELIAWASVANKGEIAAAVAERPEVGDRLRAAAQVVKERLEAQNELLGGLSEAISDGKSQAKQREKAAKARDRNQRGGNRTPAKQAATVPPPPDDDEEDDLDEVVRQDPNKVAEFIAENPQHAAAVLEAENRYATEQNAQPRDVVVKAAEVAAQHANQ